MVSRIFPRPRPGNRMANLTFQESGMETSRTINTAQAQAWHGFQAGRISEPWTVSLSWHVRPDTELLEYVCNENEKDLKHIVGK